MWMCRPLPLMEIHIGSSPGTEVVLLLVLVAGKCHGVVDLVALIQWEVEVGR